MFAPPPPSLLLFSPPLHIDYNLGKLVILDIENQSVEFRADMTSRASCINAERAFLSWRGPGERLSYFLYSRHDPETLEFASGSKRFPCFVLVFGLVQPFSKSRIVSGHRQRQMALVFEDLEPELLLHSRGCLPAHYSVLSYFFLEPTGKPQSRSVPRRPGDCSYAPLRGCRCALC